MSVNLGKKSVLTMAVLLLITKNGFGGVGARNISTQSVTAYLSGGGRYAESEDADTVLNNPAGAVFMKDGFHFHFSTMVAKTVWQLKNLDTGKEYETSSLGVLPDLAVTFKNKKWAGFFTISFPGGNGSGSYEEHPAFDYAAEQMSMAMNQTITAEDHSFDYAGGKGALTIGTAYRVNDMFSLGYGIRGVYAMGYVDAKATFVHEESGQAVGEMKLDNSSEGTGIGHSFCALFNLDKLKIGLRYDPEVEIEATKDVKSGDNSGMVDGEKKNDNMPAVIFTGLSYQVSPKIKLGGGYVYYWQKGINGDDEPITADWENAWEVQAFIEMALSPKWEVLTGVNYDNPGIPDNAYTCANTSYSKSINFTLGTQYRPSTHWTFILGAGYVHYPENPRTEADPMGLYERRVGAPAIQYHIGIEYWR